MKVRDDTLYYSMSNFYLFDLNEARWFDSAPEDYDALAIYFYQRQRALERAGRRFAASFASGFTAMILLGVVVAGTSSCDLAEPGSYDVVEPPVYLLCDPRTDPCDDGTTCQWDWEAHQTICVVSVGLGEPCNETGPLVDQVICGEGACGFVPILDEERCLAVDQWTPCDAATSWLCGPTLRCGHLYTGGAPVPGEPAICYPRECYIRDDCPHLDPELRRCVDGLCWLEEPCHY